MSVSDSAIRWRTDTRAMQIAWAIPCRYAEEINGVGNVLGAGADVFQVASLPVDLRVMCAVNIVVPEHELNTPDAIEVEVLDPAMASTEAGPHPVNFVDYPHRPAGRQPSFLNVLGFTIRVDQFGQYTLNLRLAGRVTTVPLFVTPMIG